MTTQTPDAVVPEVPHVEKALQLVAELARVPSQDLEWQLKKLRGYRDALFEHYAPFQVGDRIRLHTDYEIDLTTSWGWAGYEQMMKAGATAQVQKVDWGVSKAGAGGFDIQVVFDHEFRTARRGSETRTYTREPDDRHWFTYWRPERWWERIAPPEQEDA